MHSILLAGVIAVGGCTAPTSYLDSIRTFEKSAVATSTVARTHLLGLNRFVRNTYLDQLRDNPQQDFEQARFLEKPFAPEAIQARVEALDTVIRYAGLLGQLASSTAGQDAKDAAENLGAQIAETAERFKKDKASDVEEFATPIGQLAGAVLKIAVEEAQVSAINDAVEEAAPAVRTIAGLLRRDLKGAVQLRETVFSGLRAATIRKYARKQYSGEGERLKLLQAIQENEDKWDEMLTTDGQVVALVDSFRDAHEALVMYAKSAREPGDLAGLTAAIDLFAARAESVLTPLEKLAKT
ncbi:MAG: hypothetical protein L0210_12350 [Rhodospirillales bacterium]|nr:hypothetical protein [Rhodospirillales bacterium]